MLPKGQRIPRKLFPLLAHNFQTYKNNLFYLKIVPYTGKTARFCFSVSKKVSKSAVVRNRLRRAGYRIVQQYIDTISSPSLVLVTYKSIPQTQDDVEKNIVSLLTQAHLIQ